MRLNWRKLYQFLDTTRQASGGESWRSLATKSGVTPSLFTRISQGKPTSVKNLLRLVSILPPQFGLEDFMESKLSKGKKS